MSAIDTAEAALHRAIRLLRPEQREHVAESAADAFAALRRDVESMRREGQRQDMAMLRMAAVIATLQNVSLDAVLEEYR